MTSTAHPASRLLAPLAWAVAISLASASAAQTESFLDRSAQAVQTKVDAGTGELLSVPGEYLDVRAPDRSALARQMAVDPVTGEITGVPESYGGTGAQDRSDLARAVVVDSAGQLIDVPQAYPDVGGLDRYTLAQQLVVDPDTGAIHAVPPGYPEDSPTRDRATQANQMEVDPVTGDIQAAPGIYPTDFDADGPFDPSDNCPFFPNPLQVDRDGNGRGDPCECSDQNLSGTVNVSDLVAINLAIFGAVRETPLCDGNGDDVCNVSDIIAANQTIYRPKTSICARQPVRGP